MKKIFQPADLRPFMRRMYFVFTPFFLLVLYDADSWEARLIFLIFVMIFLAIIHTLLARTTQGGRPIVLDPRGLHHEPLQERYGTKDFPWTEITAIELVHGSKRAEWLGLTLRDGQFCNGLKRPILDRMHEGDVFLPLLHDQPGSVIVEEARRFWRRHGDDSLPQEAET